MCVPAFCAISILPSSEVLRCNLTGTDLCAQVELIHGEYILVECRFVGLEKTVIHAIESASSK